MEAFIEGATFPVMVKVADMQRAPDGVRNVAIAHTPAQLVAMYRKAENSGSPT